MLRAARPLASSSPRLIGDLGTLAFPTPLRRQSTLPPRAPTLPALLALPALPARPTLPTLPALPAVPTRLCRLPFLGRHTCSGRSLCVYLYKMLLNCVLRQPSLPTLALPLSQPTDGLSTRCSALPHAPRAPKYREAMGGLARTQHDVAIPLLRRRGVSSASGMALPRPGGIAR